MTTPLNHDSNGNAFDNGKASALSNSATRHPIPASEHTESDRKESLLTRITQLWLKKTGVDFKTYQLMFKGALAPTIAIAAYQGTPWANEYTTIGYLVGIMSVLSVPIQPRAKILQTMLINIIFVCVGCAVALLAMFCAVRARITSEGSQGPGTGGPGTSGLAAAGAETALYNSSASAVAGVWLFTQVFFISVIRARNPQFTIPCIMYSIFANVSMVYCPQFSTMAQATAFAQQLLYAFLTGFAVSTGVSLLIFPTSSRQVVFKDMTTFIEGLRSAMTANLSYLRSLEETDMFAPHRVNTAGDEVPGSSEATALKVKLQALAGANAKFSVDLPFAKREIAIGKSMMGDGLARHADRAIQESLVRMIYKLCTDD